VLARTFHQTTPEMVRDARPQTLCADPYSEIVGISGLRGLWYVLAGHIGHARLANRVVYWLRRSSPICLAQDAPQIRVPVKCPG